jgi:hypothetical protein
MKLVVALCLVAAASASNLRALKHSDACCAISKQAWECANKNQVNACATALTAPGLAAKLKAISDKADTKDPKGALQKLLKKKCLDNDAAKFPTLCKPKAPEEAAAESAIKSVDDAEAADAKAQTKAKAPTKVEQMAKNIDNGKIGGPENKKLATELGTNTGDKKEEKKPAAAAKPLTKVEQMAKNIDNGGMGNQKGKDLATGLGTNTGGKKPAATPAKPKVSEEAAAESAIKSVDDAEAADAKAQTKAKVPAKVPAKPPAAAKEDFPALPGSSGKAPATKPWVKGSAYADSATEGVDMIKGKKAATPATPATSPKPAAAQAKKEEKKPAAPAAAPKDPCCAIAFDTWMCANKNQVGACATALTAPGLAAKMTAINDKADTKDPKGALQKLLKKKCRAFKNDVEKNYKAVCA